MAGIGEYAAHPVIGNFRKYMLHFYVVCLASLLLGSQAHADSGISCGAASDWMNAGKIGLSAHYFANSPKQLKQREDQLKIDEIANQASNAGVAWVLFTLYHQPWVMMAPNDTFERIIGRDDFTSKRDIPLDLYNALNKKNIRLMLYVNLRLDPGARVSPHIREAMGGWPPNDKLVENIATIFKEFSLRYGDKVSGWWVDGVQRNSAWGKSPNRERWFKEMANALRAGNSNALVAFNPGLETVRYSQQNDYIAGESVDLRPAPNGRWIDCAQWHIWTYLGESWGLGGTRFTNETLLDYANRVFKKGGVITFEVGMNGRADYGGIQMSENIGRIDPSQVEQIRFITQRVHQLSH